LERLPEEVKIAKLGTARARNPAVKAFAERRIKENAEWDRELNALAVAKKFGLPKADRERRFENLLEKPGQVFDREFVDAQKASLKTMNEWFKEAAREVKDPDVRSLAEKLSRMAEQSHAEAEQLGSQLRGKE
jgi:putative membrane protein